MVIKSTLFLLAALLVSILGCAEDGQQSDRSTQPVDESGNNLVHLVHNEEERKVDVRIGDDLFTSYLYSDEFKPFLYPIYTAAGNPVTRGYPIEPRPGESADHPHQVGLWLNYGDVNGLDFWNHSDRIPEERRHRYGTILHEDILSISGGDDKGELAVRLNWVSPDGEVLLVENTTFIFSADGDGESTHKRVIDRITQLTAPERDVSLTDNKEGMLGLRLARELEHPDEHDDATGMYLSREGLTGHDVWGTRSEWMSLDGHIGDEPVSVAIFDHPENVGFPTYWHARGYGLFAANPLGMKEMSGGVEELNYQLDAGESITFKHRVVIWSGENASAEMVERNWAEWAAE